MAGKWIERVLWRRPFLAQEYVLVLYLALKLPMWGVVAWISMHIPTTVVCLIYVTISRNMKYLPQVTYPYSTHNDWTMKGASLKLVHH